MNVGDVIRRSARHYAGNAAITCGGQTLHAAEVYERSVRLANALLGSGLRPGDRVAMLTPNCLQSMELEFGCAIAGIVRVSLNVRLPEEHLLEVLDDVEASALIFAGRYAGIAERFAAGDGGQNVGGGGPRPMMRVEIDERDEASQLGIAYEDALAAASPKPPQNAVDADSLYCLFSSSGTTGRPKGIMLSHRAQLAVCTNLLLEYGQVRARDSILLPQPLSHGGGFFMLPYFISGGHCVVVDAFAPSVFELAERMRIDTLKIVPTMLVDLLKAGVAPTPDYAPRQIIYGAAPMPHKWLEQGLNVFGPVFAQLYGQGEAPMCVTVLSERDHEDAELLGSAGRPYRSVDVRVVDPEGREVEPGERGEVIVSGAHIMNGYWKEPERTAEVLRDGFIHTKDNATIDERGYVYLLGRSDEMINSGGFNIAPRTVERTLHGHPGIAEAVVVGSPDERWGEVVKAYVVLRPGAQLDADELIDYCRPRLGMQRPREVAFLDELPKSAYGKIVKSELGKAASAKGESGKRA